MGLAGLVNNLQTIRLTQKAKYPLYPPKLCLETSSSLNARKRKRKVNQLLVILQLVTRKALIRQDA